MHFKIRSNPFGTTLTRTSQVGHSTFFFMDFSHRNAKHLKYSLLNQFTLFESLVYTPCHNSIINMCSLKKLNCCHIYEYKCIYNHVFEENLTFYVKVV